MDIESAVGISVTDSGYGYTNAPKVTISGGGGSGAEEESIVQEFVIRERGQFSRVVEVP